MSLAFLSQAREMGRKVGRKALKNLFLELLISSPLGWLQLTFVNWTPLLITSSHPQSLSATKSCFDRLRVLGQGKVGAFYKPSGWLNYSKFSLGESCSDIKTRYILGTIIFLTSP